MRCSYLDVYHEAINEVRALKEQLVKIKQYPYPMRKRSVPDCEGLWLDSQGNYIEVRSLENASLMKYGPYHYIGPVPVIPQEQSPPKVVTIRGKQWGQEHQAILKTAEGESPSYCILDRDGNVKCIAPASAFEEVQS